MGEVVVGELVVGKMESGRSDSRGYLIVGLDLHVSCPQWWLCHIWGPSSYGDPYFLVPDSYN